MKKGVKRGVISHVKCEVGHVRSLRFCKKVINCMTVGVVVAKATSVKEEYGKEFKKQYEERNWRLTNNFVLPLKKKKQKNKKRKKEM